MALEENAVSAVGTRDLHALSAEILLRRKTLDLVNHQQMGGGELQNNFRTHNYIKTDGPLAR